MSGGTERTDGIADIDWSSLSHAYGPATDVPDLLRSLWDPERAPDAYHALFCNIWHQGTVYEATAPAVPFLLAVALSPDAPNRVDALVLLRSIAGGTSYIGVHRSSFTSFQAETAEQATGRDRQQRQEQVWVDAAYAAVATERAGLLGLVRGDLDPDVPTAAAYVLGALPGHADDLLPELRHLLREDTHQEATIGSVCAAVVELAASASPEALDGLDREFVELATNDSSALVRSIAALGCARLAPDRPLPVDPTELASDWAEAEAAWRRSPWSMERGWTDPVAALGDRPDRVIATGRLLVHPDRDVVLSALYTAPGLHQARQGVGDALTPPLIAALRSDDGELRNRAASVLSNWGELAAAGTEALLDIIEHPPPRRTANDQPSVGAFNGDERTFELALVTLVRLQEPRVIPALRTALESGPPDVVYRFIEELGPLGADLLPSLAGLLDGIEPLGQPWLWDSHGMIDHNLPIYIVGALARSGATLPGFQQRCIQHNEWWPFLEMSSVDRRLRPIIRIAMWRARLPSVGIAWIRSGGGVRRALPLARATIDEPDGLPRGGDRTRRSRVRRPHRIEVDARLARCARTGSGGAVAHHR